MDGVKWIKICTDIFEDEKIMLIENMPNGDSIILCWHKLLCLAGKQNNSGVFMINGKIPYTAEMLATSIRRPAELVKQSLEIFISLGMVEVVDGVYTIPKWEKHQNLDALETAREKNRQRVAAFRAKQKYIANGNVTSNVTSNVRVTPCVMVCNGVDKDKDKDKEKDVDDIYNNNINKQQKLFFDTYPDVVVDNYSTADYAAIDFDLLLKEFEQSRYLKGSRSFKWVCSHYREIVAGQYRDFVKEQQQEEKVYYSSNVQCWDGD